MPYNKTNWENEVPQTTPVKYEIIDDTSGIIAASATIDPVTLITPGTPLNSTNLNKLEEGVRVAQETAEAQVTTAKLIDGILSADAAGRLKMADTFITLAKLGADLRFQKLFNFVGDGVSLPDWTSIPQTFRHLIMIYTGVSSRVSAGWDGLDFFVNNDVGVNYNTSISEVSSTGNSWNFGITNPHDNGLFCGILPAQNAGNLPPGSGIVIFPDYAGTTFYKSCILLAMYMGSYVAGMSLATSYRTNAEPITRLTGAMSGYFPRAGSVFSLYGFN